MIVDFLCKENKNFSVSENSEDLKSLIPVGYDFQRVPSDEGMFRFILNNCEWSLQSLTGHRLRLKFRKGRLDFDKVLTFIDDFSVGLGEDDLVDVKFVGPWGWNAAEKVF